MTIRVGIGYDSHKFGEGRHLVLGGIKIPDHPGLVGHSDGDAIAHAITDAILGAAGAGNIGTMFPDNAKENKDRDSIEMLVLALDRVYAKGYKVQQVDVTVITESPKIAPHSGKMTELLAGALGVTSADVSIKGKTNEGMGWIGRGEGLACIAVATLTS